jgi:hypothetical protein
VTPAQVERGDARGWIRAGVGDDQRLYAELQASAVAVPTVENFALVELDRQREAALLDVGDEFVELRAFDQRKGKKRGK